MRLYVKDNELFVFAQVLRSLRLKIAVVFSVLISMMFVILGTAVSEEVNVATESQVNHLEKVAHTMESLIENMQDLRRLVEQFKVEENILVK
ncbi:hypothetical protein [Bacillus cereus]|uniref:Methyl-accepting chemotaxis protein n=2 Tax=Bacillus TaxID=1386 RepID=A0A2B8SNC4_BACCE|nr:hypothetical protein [Bacillus cereus]PDY80374.1 hypothetical protein CON06_22145 [Bacillus cereus]PFA09231.1 hypothetical protein CN382_23415 [Bacillus cereus]PFM39066.1 hypothetical protein COJ43_15220 [Bacillus cereus]PGL58817.1 hypothetical protein CN927_20095 [Bacillus cereus]PGQ08942.1 hypothetical protein COA08_13675 [Bacillus cereus]